MYFSIPYLGYSSFNLRNKLNKLVREFFPQVSLKVVFSPSKNIQSLFRYKDIIPHDLRSSVVYRFQCDSCRASYIGKCERHLKTRIAEHQGRSVRTGNYITKPLHSAIREHCENQQHSLSKSNFSILASSSDSLDLIIMEALYQHRDKPSLGRASYELVCV